MRDAPAAAWKAGIQQVQAESAGIARLCIIDGLGTLEIGMAAMAGDADAGRMLTAITLTHAQVRNAPRRTPAPALDPQRWQPGMIMRPAASEKELREQLYRLSAKGPVGYQDCVSFCCERAKQIVIVRGHVARRPAAIRPVRSGLQAVAARHRQAAHAPGRPHLAPPAEG